MAEKMKISVGADVSELQQGMEQGKQSIEVFEKQVDDLNATIQDQINSSKTLRQEQRAAMVQVQKLTSAYMKLSDEEKRSAVGQEMARQLHEAEEQAAKLTDATGDLNQRIRTMSSDTRNLDIMKDTFEAVGSAATSILSGIAAVTGKQEDLNRAIAVFGTIQSTVNTVTKVANILNKDSNLLIGIQTLQTRALTRAKQLETAATGKATIAQRLLNTVARANPYVLIASTAIAATAAIWGFIAATDKATESISDEAKMAIEMNKISVQAKKDTISETVSLDLLYRKTQDTTKSINERKDAAKKLIDQYPNYFSNMTEEQIMLGNASGIYQQLKRDIIAVATAKAYQTKIEKDAARVIEIDAEIEQHRLQQERIRAQYSNLTQEQLEKRGGGSTASYLYNKEGDAINELIKEKERLTKEQEKYAKKIDESTDAIVRQQNVTNNGTNNGSNNSDTPTVTVRPVVDNADDLTKQIENILKDDVKFELPKPDFSSLSEGFKEYGDQLYDGAKTLVSKIKSLYKLLDNDKLTDEQKEQIESTISTLETELNSIMEKLNVLDNMNISIKADIDKQAFDKKVNEILNGTERELLERKLEIEFEVPDEFKDQLDTLKDQILDLYDLSKEYENTPYFDQIKDKLGELIPLYEAIAKKAQEVAEKNKKINDTLSLTGEMLNMVGDIAGSVGSIFENKAANITAIIARAVATYLLGWTEATAKASKLGAIGWLGFSLSTAAQAFSMVAQIKNAAKFEDGGVVGGHDYYGDKILARLNSKELVIPADKKEYLGKWMDAVDNYQPSKQFITGEVKVVGSDLWIALRNLEAKNNKLR